MEQIEYQAKVITDKKIQERYKPLARLGEGAYARVIKAQHNETMKEVAIKMICTAKCSFKDRERAQREINIASILNHPHIVKVFEIYKDDERKQTHLVQELLAGGDLLDFIVANGPLPENRAVRLLKGALEAIQYLHNLGYAHRDLKPENLVLDADHKILKLIDFGFAKSKNDMYGLETPIGTPGWQALDVMKGEPYSLAVDMWSIGCIVYFTLFAVPPFSSNKTSMEDKISELNEIVQIGRYEFPSTITISANAQDFISRLLEKDPNIRMTASQALEHVWMRNIPSLNVPQDNLTDHRQNTIDNVKKNLLRQSINIAIDRARKSAEEIAQRAVDADVNLVLPESINLSEYTNK